MTCKKSPALTGACRVVKGSLGLTPGLGVTLVAEDGARTIIKAPPDSNADIAPPVMQNWLYWQSKTGSMKTRITRQLRALPPAHQHQYRGHHRLRLHQQGHAYHAGQIIPIKMIRRACPTCHRAL